jgi:hypothetical protein
MSKPNIRQNTTCKIGTHQNDADASANNGRKRSLHLDCKKTCTEEEKKHDGMFSPSFKREKPLCREEFQKMLILAVQYQVFGPICLPPGLYCVD